MRKIILASESPRRRELLAQMGVVFETMRSDYDEQLDESRDVVQVAKELGLGKALAVARQHPQALVIGSDTIVSFNGRQLGKQPDRATAKRLLQAMSGKAVGVTTSVALVCQATGLQEVIADTARIVFESYDDVAINSYLDSGDWEDKAAAVAIQSPYTIPVARIEGSYDTILGLATTPLCELLRQQGLNCSIRK